MSDERNTSAQVNSNGNSGGDNSQPRVSTPQASLAGRSISDLLSGGAKPTMRPITEGFSLHEDSPSAGASGQVGTGNTND